MKDKKTEKKEEIKRIKLTDEQIEHLNFLDDEVRMYEHKRQAAQETSSKFVGICFVKRKVPNGWGFNRDTYTFISQPSTAEKKGERGS